MVMVIGTGVAFKSGVSRQNKDQISFAAFAPFGRWVGRWSRAPTCPPLQVGEGE